MPDRYRLGFAEAFILDQNTVELVIDDGVDVSTGMLEEFLTFIAQHVPTGCVLLINKKNTYSYQYEAQVKVNAVTYWSKVAILAVHPHASAAIDSISISAEVPRQWPVAMFVEREQALMWLRT